MAGRSPCASFSPERTRRTQRDHFPVSAPSAAKPPARAFLTAKIAEHAKALPARLRALRVLRGEISPAPVLLLPQSLQSTPGSYLATLALSAAGPSCARFIHRCRRERPGEADPAPAPGRRGPVPASAGSVRAAGQAPWAGTVSSARAGLSKTSYGATRRSKSATALSRFLEPSIFTRPVGKTWSSTPSMRMRRRPPSR